ncbi:MAG: hypothetical protein U0T73_06335 [Chitinophagales bacterium]
MELGPQGPSGIGRCDWSKVRTGANGTNGLNGAKGPVHKDLQDYWRTRCDWPRLGPTGLLTAPMVCEWCPGPQGPIQDPDGATGAQGPQGPTGANGTNGLNGATGPQGPSGLDGALVHKDLQVGRCDWRTRSDWPN